MGRVIGIDLGTTTTLVAYCDRSSKTPRIIANRSGGSFTPSVVRFGERGEILIGVDALNSRTLDPLNTVSSAKRLMGRYYSEITDTLDLLPYSVIPGTEGESIISIRGELLSPEKIGSLILTDLVQTASSLIAEDVDSVIVGVPAYFTQRQRDATRRAVEIAGYTLGRLIIEPVAASLYYNWNVRAFDRTSVVIDLGGGTFDVTVLGYGPNVNEVLAVNGDRLLGGNDFDERLVELVTEKIRRQHGHEIDKRDPVLQQRLLDACISAKCELSEQPSAIVSLPYCIGRDGRVYDFSVEVTLTEFDSVCEELFERLRNPILQALVDAKISSEGIHSVMFVGSATRMKRVQNLVRGIFPSARFRIANPGEAVALGAAVQAGIIEGSLDDYVHIDAIPFGIGIEDEFGRTSEIICPNTTVPVSKCVWITNAISNTTTLEVHVLQGSAEMAIDNISLARIVLDGVQPVPRGVGIFRIDVDVNVNSEISVTLSEESSRLSKTISIAT